MSEQVDLTVRKLRHASNLEGSDFLRLYQRLMRHEQIPEHELVAVLRFAVLFLRSTDEVVSRLGYRMILQYGELTGDYEPLHAVARERDLIPVVAATERLNPDLRSRESFQSILFDAHATNFLTDEPDGTTLRRTRGQMELRDFNLREPRAIIVAPTSYGKSEMLIEKIVRRLDAATCVIVPSRALIAQTRQVIISDPRIQASRIRVLTHPDAYTGEERFVAVMTQERLQRLFADHPDLKLDQLLVDEAHNLLPQGTRPIDLSQAILIASGRNKDLAITYYTPFMAEPDMLRHVGGADVRAKSRAVNEHVKAERLVHAEPGSHEELYDQFLDRMIPLGRSVPSDEVDAVLSRAEHRTLVYVNRPRDAQHLSLRIAQRRGAVVMSVQAQRAIRAVGDLIDPRYSLITAIKSGVLFHHGQIPDVLRQYIEMLFRTDRSDERRLLVTTSTLLEGVNTPADCLVLMTPAHGRGYLSRSAFRNLIGRVARFREVFDPRRENLNLLQPRIYLVPSSYARSNWNVSNFLSRVANLARSVEDTVANPLLEAAGDSDSRARELEYLNNIEPDLVQVPDARSAETEVGVLCFRNGVRDFDIFDFEHEIQARVDRMRLEPVLVDVRSVIDAVCDVFLRGVELDDGDDLGRIQQHEEARKFYSMFLGWRTRNEPFKLLIAHFVAYWNRMDQPLAYVGSKWGEETYGDGVLKLWVDMRRKSTAGKINLAVVRIKAEQDFVDFRLMKYVEILNALGLIDLTLYQQIKYGTADPYLICLLRNGFSPELARLVSDEYSDLVVVDTDGEHVSVLPELPDHMSQDDQNDVLVYEARTLVNVGLSI
ncbi:DEAD/DEAH box helicase [Cellulomonas taurus]|uniref:DEAD/DEAH box helicase n=1 Tax=Cellulomonas taurus TaxID=2729175 RepID=UPI00145FB9C5|nr:DEAD/DEAH box helicase [Cellulomonas taurus]